MNKQYFLDVTIVPCLDTEDIHRQWTSTMSLPQNAQVNYDNDTEVTLIYKYKKQDKK